jgi:hypothetical protein
MKVSFYNATSLAVSPAAFRVIEPPDSNLLIQISRIGALPRADETVIVAGAIWIVMEVVHLVGPGDDYEARVWLRPGEWREAP